MIKKILNFIFRRRKKEEWKFEVVLGLSDAVPQKPDPTGAFKIANQLNIPPSDFIYIGDTAVDLKTAIAADMLPVGVLWGFRDKKELEDNGARFIVDKPLQILDILKEEESAPESRS